MDWGLVKEKVAGLGKKLFNDMLNSNKKKEQNLAERKQIWRQALDMCETDKASFKTELINTQHTIKLMTTPVKFDAELADFTLTKDLAKYTAVIGKMDMGTLTAAEISANKANLAEFTTDVEKVSSAAADNEKAARALKMKLIS